MEMSVEKSSVVIHAILCLHNYLVEEVGVQFNNVGETEDAIASQCTLQQAQMRLPNAHRYPQDADDVRNLLIEYFSGPGAVDWQNEQVFLLPENQRP